MPANSLPEHWLRLGQGEPHWLWLHGFMGSGQDWLPQIQALTAYGTHLSPDLAGHGCNPSQACSLPEMAQQILTELSQAGIQQVHLVGYSMGGRLAFYLLHHAPERILSAVLESTSPGLAQATERQARWHQDQELAWQLETGDWENFLARWYQQALFTSLRCHPAFEHVLASRRQQDPLRLACSLRQAGTGSMAPLWEVLPAMTQPLLYLAGEQDSKYLALGRQIQQHCPHLQLQILPGGHNLHVETPQHWLAAFKAFYHPSWT